MRKAFMEVVELSTGKVIHRVDVTSKSERERERVLMGMLRNMDTDRYSVREPPPEKK